MNTISLLSLKLVREKTFSYDFPEKISFPDDAVETLNATLDLQNKAEEFFVMITLDTKNHVTGLFEISHGSLNGSIVHPREVFKRALLQNACSIIVAHNHPSGDPTPINEDINITKRLVECGRLIGIDVLDHLIICHNSFLSLKQLYNNIF